ncbi:hypothetical protein Lalb_Chr21g0311111 [Lupinus albus]|uniref:Uncharacterized protein n=1 Tax=Lupinus albus TaxID=3870 RepID=A0A6A4NQF8_LUPAL|nr:hypothetical protein Lalb_Chr21g0311111 [Lupinus albus]
MKCVFSFLIFFWKKMKGERRGSECEWSKCRFMKRHSSTRPLSSAPSSFHSFRANSWLLFFSLSFC